jgi:hypothetical protein
MGELNKDGCIWLPNIHDPPKLDELLGAVDEFDGASPKLPVELPEGFAIDAGDIVPETSSSINLVNVP